MGAEMTQFSPSLLVPFHIPLKLYGCDKIIEVVDHKCRKKEMVHLFS